MFLNNQQVIEEIKREIKKISRNKWQWKHKSKPMGAAFAEVLRGKFIAIQSYLKKQEKHWIDNLTLHLKQMEKEEQQQQKKPKKLVKGKKDQSRKKQQEIRKTLNRQPNFTPKTTG